jgi:hypothetical protein
MDEHFTNGIDIKPLRIKVQCLPDGLIFEDLDVNSQRLLVAAAQQKQIAQLQGDKVALLCMRKISLYETYEDAKVVQDKIPFIDSQIFIPRHYKGIVPPSTNKTGVFQIS